LLLLSTSVSVVAVFASSSSVLLVAELRLTWAFVLPAVPRGVDVEGEETRLKPCRCWCIKGVSCAEASGEETLRKRPLCKSGNLTPHASPTSAHLERGRPGRFIARAGLRRAPMLRLAASAAARLSAAGAGSVAGGCAAREISAAAARRQVATFPAARAATFPGMVGTLHDPARHAALAGSGGGPLNPRSGFVRGMATPATSSVETVAASTVKAAAAAGRSGGGGVGGGGASSWMSAAVLLAPSALCAFLCKWQVETWNPKPLTSTPYAVNPASFTLLPSPYVLNPAPYTLHPAPCTMHPTTYTLHRIPYTLHPTSYTPYTMHPASYTLHHPPSTLHLSPSTLQPKPCTLHPQTYTLQYKPCTLHPTLHPTPYIIHPSPYTIHQTL